MPNYQNGKIYCLRSHQTDKIYIGSTTQKLYNRKSKHKHQYRCNMKNMDSYEIAKYDDCYIELLEKYPCNSKEELHRKEGEYIRKMDCVNKRIAGRTNKEYREDNRQIVLKKRKEYYNKNKNTYSIKAKVYYEKNKDTILKKMNERGQKKLCECGSNVIEYNINRHKKTKKHLKHIENN